MISINLEEPAAAFKAAWAEGDTEGVAGGSVEAGLAAALPSILKQINQGISASTLFSDAHTSRYGRVIIGALIDVTLMIEDAEVIA